MIEKGFSFPEIFNAATKTTKKVEDRDKTVSDIALVIRQQVRMVLFRPNVGVDWESIMFASDVDVTRDFIWTFVSEAIVSSVEKLELIDVRLNSEREKVKCNILFRYKEQDISVSVDYIAGGDLIG